MAMELTLQGIFSDFIFSHIVGLATMYPKRKPGMANTFVNERIRIKFSQFETLLIAEQSSEHRPV